jgi:UDP-3-O-[3-hydroxymyristoyl] glucosamine N-acyltransferase
VGARGGPFTLRELARVLGATLEGEPDQTVDGVAPLETAGPRDISFLASPRYRRLAARGRAGALVVPQDATGLPGALLRVPSPQQALIALLRLFHPEPPVAPGVHPTAVVAPDARVDPTASVGPCAVIERGAAVGRGSRIGALVFVGADVVIGEDVILYPHVVVRDGVRIGSRVIVHPGAVIGADGFGYAFDGAVHRKIPQVGGVRIEDDVEIGANTAVDRGTVGDTVIRRGTKIDNLVQVAHNCEVGEDTVIVAQVGVSGSSRIGRRVVLAGQAGVADHVTIADGAIVTARAGVVGDIPSGGVWGGAPCRPIGEARRIWAAEGMLPDLVKRVRALEQRVRELEGDRGR